MSSGLETYTLEETAKLLGVSPKTLRNWCLRRKIDHCRPARGVFVFLPSHIAEYLRQSQVLAVDGMSTTVKARQTIGGVALPKPGR